MGILKNKRQITNLDIIEPAKMAAKGGHIEWRRNSCFVHNDAILELKLNVQTLWWLVAAFNFYISNMAAAILEFDQMTLLLNAKTPMFRHTVGVCIWLLNRCEHLKLP